MLYLLWRPWNHSQEKRNWELQSGRTMFCEKWCRTVDPLRPLKCFYYIVYDQAKYLGAERGPANRWDVFLRNWIFYTRLYRRLPFCRSNFQFDQLFCCRLFVLIGRCWLPRISCFPKASFWYGYVEQEKISQFVKTAWWKLVKT